MNTYAKSKLKRKILQNQKAMESSITFIGSSNDNTFGLVGLNFTNTDTEIL